MVCVVCMGSGPLPRVWHGVRSPAARKVSRRADLTPTDSTDSNKEFVTEDLTPKMDVTEDLTPKWMTPKWMGLPAMGSGPYPALSDITLVLLDL